MKHIQTQNPKSTIESYLFLDNGGRLKRSSKLRLILKTFTSFLQETFFTLTFTDLDHVILSSPATFVGVDGNLVTVATNLCSCIGSERHRFELGLGCENSIWELKIQNPNFRLRIKRERTMIVGGNLNRCIVVGCGVVKVVMDLNLYGSG